MLCKAAEERQDGSSRLEGDPVVDEPAAAHDQRRAASVWSSAERASSAVLAVATFRALRIAMARWQLVSAVQVSGGKKETLNRG